MKTGRFVATIAAGAAGGALCIAVLLILCAYAWHNPAARTAWPLRWW
jgi:hypothetical protein